MSATPYKTEYGIYPATPGFEVSIGDYGVWDGHSWCPLGNIFEDFKPISFQEKTEDVDRTETCDIGVKMSATAASDINIPAAKAKVNLEFCIAGGLHYRAHIVRTKRFTSVQNEVYPFLQKYLTIGRWDPKFWLAVEVCYADNLISLQSKTKGTGIGIIGDTQDELKLAQADFEANFRYDKTNISALHFSGKIQFAGAKFVSFTTSGIFRKKLAPNYVGESLDFETASEQSVY